MQQFDLSLWLQDKSRKVVTRDGRPVRIICWDVKQGTQDGCYVPILALIDKGEEIGENVFYYTEDGKFLRNTNETHNCDLFFADEEEELTEFEKAIYIDICTIVTACDGNVYGDKELKPIVKGIAKDLLDLARKELLEDLPKWKKATEHKDLEKHIAILEDGKVLLSDYLEEGDYYIDLEDLKTLPKEE